MKLAAVLVATFQLLCGCASAPPAAKIQGHYTVRGEGWSAYEDITLSNGNFRWLFVTGGARLPDSLTGFYSFEGNLLIFHHPLMRQPKRVLTQHNGNYVMWTPTQYKEFLKTGQTPMDVLYQTR